MSVCNSWQPSPSHISRDTIPLQAEVMIVAQLLLVTCVLAATESAGALQVRAHCHPRTSQPSCPYTYYPIILYFAYM